MSTPNALLMRHRRTILVTAAIGAAIALAIDIVQPFQYRAASRILIIQSTSPTLDAFTAVKSSEKIGRNLGRVIVSSSFLDHVLAANPAIDRSAFPTDERRRRRAWERTVESAVAAETSVMEIRVYHPQRTQALAVAEGIQNVLLRDVSEYTGSRDVTMKIIDSPIVTKYPVRPNVPLHLAIGFLLAGLLGTAFVYLREGMR